MRQLWLPPHEPELWPLGRSLQLRSNRPKGKRCKIEEPNSAPYRFSCKSELRSVDDFGTLYQTRIWNTKAIVVRLMRRHAVSTSEPQCIKRIVANTAIARARAVPCEV